MKKYEIICCINYFIKFTQFYPTHLLNDFNSISSHFSRFMQQKCFMLKTRKANRHDIALSLSLISFCIFLTQKTLKDRVSKMNFNLDQYHHHFSHCNEQENFACHEKLFRARRERKRGKIEEQSSWMRQESNKKKAVDLHGDNKSFIFDEMFVAHIKVVSRI